MSHQNTSSFTIQTTIAVILFILGLLFLVIWAILYANRLSNNLTPQWWIWMFLGFGVALILIGLIWLIVVQYLVGMQIHRLYQQLYGAEEFLEYPIIERKIVERPIVEKTIPKIERTITTPVTSSVRRSIPLKEM